MQERFLMLPHSWILLNGLKNDLKKCLEEMQARNFEHFLFLQDVESAQIPSFETVLQRCLLNMETRFPCPSKSFNMRHANEHLNTSQNSIDVGLLKTIQQSCTLFELVGLFIFPDDLIKRRQINPIFLEERFSEVRTISREIVEKEELIKTTKHKRHRLQNVEHLEETITLLDVLETIERDNFPVLWGITLKLL